MNAKFGRLTPIAASVLAVVASASAVAQPVIEEVIVTAQKREQSLQEVPIAVTAFSQESLQQNGVVDITDIQKLTPNTTLQTSRGTNSTLTAFIRGIGQQDPLWGFEPGVGIYVDDVYIARPQGAIMDLLDISSIEVLRGPQGTLYGKNTIGGAVKYTTSRLDDEASFSLGATLGQYSQRDLRVSASSPLTDNLRIGAAIASFNRDGYGTNLTDGEDQYNKDVLAARVVLEYDPSESFFVRFSADSTQDDSNPKHGHRFAAGLGGEPVLPSVYDTESNMPSENSVETSGMSLVMDWDVSDMVQLKSVTAYREGTTETVIDFDSVNRPDFDVPAYYEDDQLSQEFQMNLATENSHLVAGIYYYTGTASGAFDAVLGYLSAIGGLTQHVAGSVDTDSFSVYGHYDYALTDALTLNVGGRYTKDDKAADVYKANHFGVYTPMFAHYWSGNAQYPTAASPTPFAVLTDYSNDDSWSKFTPRLGLDYQISDDLMVYASYSSGFKSGGFDMRGDASVNPETVEGFDPETVDTIEMGWKADLFDNRMRLNGSIFRADYTDMQVTTQTLVAGGGFASAVLNAGESRIQGIELETSIAFTESLSLNATYGYVDAEFIEFNSGGVNIADQLSMQNTPDTTAMVQLNWSMPLFGGELVTVPSWSYRADTQIFERPGLLDQEAYSLVDLTMTYYSANENWRVSLLGKNLADETYRIAGYSFGGAFDTGFYGAPRTVAVSFEYDL